MDFKLSSQLNQTETELFGMQLFRFSFRQLSHSEGAYPLDLRCFEPAKDRPS